MLFHEGHKAVELDEVVSGALSHEFIPAAVSIQTASYSVIDKICKLLWNTNGHVRLCQLVTPCATKVFNWGRVTYVAPYETKRQMLSWLKLR